MMLTVSIYTSHFEFFSLDDGACEADNVSDVSGKSEMENLFFFLAAREWLAASMVDGARLIRDSRGLLPTIDLCKRNGKRMNHRME